MIKPIGFAVFAAALGFATSAYAIPDGPYRDAMMREMRAQCDDGDVRACRNLRRMKINSRIQREEREERGYGGYGRY
jgi:hypothetical protein